jgi:lipoprotein-releasing system permease protein
MLIRRYLFPGKADAFIALVARVSLAAVVLGITALLVIMSVMNGFRAELFDKLVGVNGHAVVQSSTGQIRNWPALLKDIRALPNVTRATPLVQHNLIASKAKRLEGVLVQGERVEDIRTNTRLSLVAGKLETLSEKSNSIAIGQGLAENLGVGVGSQITLISPQTQAPNLSNGFSDSAVLGALPKVTVFRVGAIVKLGIWDFDKLLVLMPLGKAQTLLGFKHDVNAITIETTDPDKIGNLLPPLRRTLPPDALVSDWRQENSALFEAMALDRIGVAIVASMVILVALANVVSSLIMLVRAKSRDIAVLMTMGLSRKAISRVFITIGMTIGGLGVLLGCGLALLVLHYLTQIVDFVQSASGVVIWDPAIRTLAHIPTQTSISDILFTVLGTLCVCWLFALYPARQAAKTDPVMVLRYE